MVGGNIRFLWVILPSANVHGMTIKDDTLVHCVHCKYLKELARNFKDFRISKDQKKAAVNYRSIIKEIFLCEL